MTTENRGLTEFLKSIPIDTIRQYYKQAVDVGIVDVALYPFDYADTLVRLGYEPFPPVEEHTLFKRKSLVLPGVTSYVYYLYSIDGMQGMFRGVLPYVTGNLIYRHLSKYILDRSPFPLERPDGEPRLNEQFTNLNVGHFLQTRLWRLVSNVIAIHIAYPFHVVGIRTMARFVAAAAASEEGYRPEFTESWIYEISRIKGFEELFAGCQARIIKEVAFAVIAGGSFLALMRFSQFLKADPQQAEPLERSLELLGNSIAEIYVNPFRNVSYIMIINKTDIPLGNPPYNEVYSSCWECCKNLKKDRFWKSSSSGGIFHPGRYYKGQVIEINGRLYPRGTYFGPVYMPKYAHGTDDLPRFLRGHYDAWDKMGGIYLAGRTGMSDPFIEDSMLKQTRSDSLAMGGIGMQTTLMSEQVASQVLGWGSNNFNFYTGSSNNPFGL